MSTAATAGGRTAPDLAGQVALITGAAHGQGRAPRPWPWLAKGFGSRPSTSPGR